MYYTNVQLLPVAELYSETYTYPDSTWVGKSGQLPVFVNKILLNTPMLIVYLSVIALMLW